MFVLGIQGSPRKNGNCDHLLTLFLKACESHGAKTQVIHPGKLAIGPCRELIVCEKKGFCPIRDEMEEKGYSLVKKADVVVLASPVFFYNVTAQAKVFIDRCQMFWGRKYKLKLRDPDGYSRQGFLLSVGASGGKRLFEGVELTAKYFFDAISADYVGSLTYRNVEDAGDILPRPELTEEIQDAARHLLKERSDKKIILFVSMTACLSQMAAAFVKDAVKGKFTVLTAGMDSESQSDPQMVRVMAEKHLDLKYQAPLSLDAVLKELDKEPDLVIFLGPDQVILDLPFANLERWNLVPSDTNSQEGFRALRGEIEQRVQTRLPSMGV